ALLNSEFKPGDTIIVTRGKDAFVFTRKDASTVAAPATAPQKHGTEIAFSREEPATVAPVAPVEEKKDVAPAAPEKPVKPVGHPTVSQPVDIADVDSALDPEPPPLPTKPKDDGSPKTQSDGGGR